MKNEDLHEIERLVESPIKEAHSEERIAEMCEDSL